VLKIGINDEFGHSGPALALLEEYGLTAKSIASKTEEFFKQT
jgi:transketolase